METSTYASPAQSSSPLQSWDVLHQQMHDFIIALQSQLQAATSQCHGSSGTAAHSRVCTQECEAPNNETDAPTRFLLEPNVFTQPICPALLEQAGLGASYNPQAEPSEPTTPPLLAPSRRSATNLTSLPPRPPRQPSLLPPQRGPKRKTLVLDLDLALIECLYMERRGSCEPDFIYTGWCIWAD